MNWKLKALIQRFVSRLPAADTWYYLMQRSCGRLGNYDYHYKLTQQKQMAELLLESNFKIKDAVVFEVGTGWIPLVPVGFWFLGAKKTITCDINRYLSRRLLRHALKWIAAHKKEVLALWAGLAPAAELAERHEIVCKSWRRPEEFLRHAGISYLAPSDAAMTNLPANSIDIHISTNVMEHIPSNVLLAIMREGHRILKPHGAAMHFIDPSDHFAHADRSISYVNFLQYEDAVWERIGGNKYAYHNRLREDDFHAIFSDAAFTVIRRNFRVDDLSLHALKNGLPIAPRFRGTPAQNLARCCVKYLATPRCRQAANEKSRIA